MSKVVSLLSWLKRKKQVVFSEALHIGDGFSIYKKGFSSEVGEWGQIEPLYISDKHRNSHMIITGTTRVGKTFLLSNLACADIRDNPGRSLIIIDPKGDTHLLTSIIRQAHKSKRLKELIVVNPIFPNISAKIDPLMYSFSIEEKASHILSAIKADDEFYVNIANEVLLAIMYSIELMNTIQDDQNKIPLNLHVIKEYVSHPDLERLKGELDANKKYYPLEKFDEIMSLLNQVLSSPPEYFAKVSSTLRTTLTAMSTGSIGQIIGKSTENDVIRRLENDEPVILVVQTGSLLTRRTAHMVSRMMLSMIQSFVGRRNATNKKVKKGLSIYIDEAQQVLYQGVETLFALAGSVNCKLAAFSQSFSQYTDELGESKAKVIFDCANSKISMRMNDPASCEYVSAMGGTTVVLQHVISSSGPIVSRENELVRIKPEDVSNLKEREFFMFSYDGVFFGRTAAGEVLKDEDMITYPEVKAA